MFALAARADCLSGSQFVTCCGGDKMKMMSGQKDSLQYNWYGQLFRNLMKVIWEDS